MPSRCDSANLLNVVTSDWHPRLSQAVALRLEGERALNGSESRSTAIQQARTAVRGASPTETLELRGNGRRDWINDPDNTKGRFEHEHEHEGNSRLLHRGCEHKTDGLCTAGTVVLTGIRFPPHPPVSHSAPARGTRSTCPGIESGDGNSVQGASFRLVGA